MTNNNDAVYGDYLYRRQQEWQAWQAAGKMPTTQYLHNPYAEQNLLQDLQAWQANIRTTDSTANKPCEEKMTRTTSIWNVLVSHFEGKKLVIDLDTTIIAATEQDATLKAATQFTQLADVDYLIDCQSIVTYEIPSGD